MASQHSAGRTRKRDPAAFALLIAVGIALVTTVGVSFGAAGFGEIRQALRSIGFGQDGDLEAKQEHQAAAIARLERGLNRMVNDVEILYSRTGDAVQADAIIKDEIGSVIERQNQISGPNWRSRIEDAAATASLAGIEINALRSTLEVYNESQSEAIANVGKRVDSVQTLVGNYAEGQSQAIGNLGARIDRIEQILSARESTSGIQAKPPGAPPRKRTYPIISGWTVQGGGNGTATITGQAGSYEVTSGSIVPGIGRITKVQQRGERLIVVTQRGIIIQR
jgi:hypothetical protein